MSDSPPAFAYPVSPAHVRHPANASAVDEITFRKRLDSYR
jgi:hypothetical protein